VKQYDGLKHSDERDDAFHLAHLLRLGVLPTGHIYPKQARSVICCGSEAGDFGDHPRNFL